MKKTSRIVAFVMSVVMVLALCACGDNAYKQIEGSWVCDLDVTEVMNNELESSLDVDDIDSGDVSLVFPVELIFNADRTYHFVYDQEKIAESFETYIDWLCVWVTDYMMEMMVDETGYSAELIDAVFESEYGMTLAEYVVAMMEESIDLDTLFAESQMEVSGYYKVEDNKLYLSSTTEFDDDSYLTYLISDNTLSIVEVVGEHEVFWEDIDEFADFPIAFSKN